jgi:hypothetical protein
VRRSKNKRKAARAKAPPKRHADRYDDDFSIAFAEIEAEALQQPQPPKQPTIQEAIAQARLAQSVKPKSSGGRRDKYFWPRIFGRVDKLLADGQTETLAETIWEELPTSHRPSLEYLQKRIRRHRREK